MKFHVFKDGQPVRDFTVSGAYLFGTDGIAIRKAQIEFSDGVLDCRKATSETGGLALLWPIAGYGKVLMPTTCLPERKRPYILNVEIARAKLMQIVNKREDWSYFAGIENLEDNSGQAVEKFIEAIGCISDPPKASVLADEALDLAMKFCEQLAVKQAQTAFSRKLAGRGFNRGCLGCKVDPGQIGNPDYVEKFTDAFGLATVPFNWGSIEEKPGVFDFSLMDKCVKKLVRRKVVLSGGPLLSFTEDSLPVWLVRNKTSFEKIREAAYRFVAKTVARYAELIRGWRVISGLNAFNYFGFSFEQVLEMTRAATLAVKSASPRALKIVEISNPWGEYYASKANTIPPLVYVDMVIQSGINFDAFGLRLPLGKAQDGMHMRDMLQLSSVLDHFSPIAKPFYVHDVEIPSGQAGGRHHGDLAGSWKGNWDQDNQALWLERFFTIALSKPFVNAVTYANLTDNESNVIVGSGLLDENLEQKKSYQMFKKLQLTMFNK